jgi:hypothetical protein
MLQQPDECCQYFCQPFNCFLGGVAVFVIGSLWLLLMLLDCADINVTPDKRQIFLLHEALLLATVKVVSVTTLAVIL